MCCLSQWPKQSPFCHSRRRRQRHRYNIRIVPTKNTSKWKRAKSKNKFHLNIYPKQQIIKSYYPFFDENGIQCVHVFSVLLPSVSILRCRCSVDFDCAWPHTGTKQNDAFHRTTNKYVAISSRGATQNLIRLLFSGRCCVSTFSQTDTRKLNDAKFIVCVRFGSVCLWASSELARWVSERIESGRAWFGSKRSHLLQANNKTYHSSHPYYDYFHFIRFISLKVQEKWNWI